MPDRPWPRQVGEAHMAAAEPATAGEGPLRHPASQRRGKTGGGGPVLDLQDVAAGTSPPGPLGAGVVAVDPEATQPVMGAGHFEQQQPKAFAQMRVNGFERAIGQPASGVSAAALRRHAASWQVPPLSATAQRVAGGVGHFTSGVLQLSSDGNWFWKAVGYESSFRKGKVLCVAHPRGVISSISWARLLPGAGVGVFKQALAATSILLAQAGQPLPIDAFLDFLSKIMLIFGVVAIFWGGWKIARGELGEGIMAIAGGFIMIIAIPIARHLMGL